MRKFCIPVILVTALTGVLSAQTIIEAAAAAAGGSAAGVAGKKVSDGLDKVLTKVSDMAKTSASDDGSGKRRIAPAVPPVPEVRIRTFGQGADGKSKASASPARRPGTVQAFPVTPDAEPASPPPVEPAVAAAPPPPAPTVEDLKSLSSASREEVVSKMGKPAARITITDERGLVETYTYRNQNGNLGSVRMINGKVEEVRPVVQ